MRGKENRGSDRARRPAGRRLGVESLESRAMLAGNVLVNVDSAGNLRITGDNADNQFTISQSGNGAYLIVGQNTTINGLGSRNVTGVRRSLDIDLRGGNDDVTFTGALPGGARAAVHGNVRCPRRRWQRHNQRRQCRCRRPGAH